MSREEVATALDEAAEALARAAHALRGIEPPAPSGVSDGPRPAASAAGVPPAPAAPLPPKKKLDEPAFTKCPAHGKEWTDGKFGPYCTGHEPEGVEHDGNWYNDRGYCRVTPKSAGAWLKQHPQGAPAPAAQDVDDIPF